MISLAVEKDSSGRSRCKSHDMHICPYYLNSIMFHSSPAFNLILMPGPASLSVTDLSCTPRKGSMVIYELSIGNTLQISFAIVRSTSTVEPMCSMMHWCAS